MNSEKGSSQLVADDDPVLSDEPVADESVAADDSSDEDGHSDESAEPELFQKPANISNEVFNYQLDLAIKRIAREKGSDDRLLNSVKSALDTHSENRENIIATLERSFPGSSLEIDARLKEFLHGHQTRLENPGRMKRLGDKFLRRTP